MKTDSAIAQLISHLKCPENLEIPGVAFFQLGADRECMCGECPIKPSMPF